MRTNPYTLPFTAPWGGHRGVDMVGRASAFALTALLCCSACVGSAGRTADEPAAAGTPAPTVSSQQPYNAAAASPAEQWAHFVHTARHRRLPRSTWPSTGKNAMMTAAVMCHNPASHGATELGLYHRSRHWAAIRMGDILFARAFCPEAEGALTQALDGGPDTALAVTLR
jgi:hypothetical protein